MNNEYPNRVECSEFEALLAEALDNALPEETRQSFEEHGRSCRVCGPLWTEAQEGLALMRSLEQVEPPKNLVHNILAATSMTQARATSAATATAKTGWLDRLRAGSLGGLLHSRFAASFAMAFFSLSLTLTLTGVKVTQIDWHPSALRKSVVLQFTHVEAKVTSYYENLRLVYEVQARVREMRKTAAPAPGTNDQNKQQNRMSAPDDGGRPQPEENYSQETDGSLVAQSLARHEGAQL
ncbi:MAG TPA: zf-HC2 domain-containing protein [Candidatus Angelobacter sp.]|nr:zf-HC2 domain-containing protein [Candidatus Angelobacter sp.]